MTRTPARVMIADVEPQTRLLPGSGTQFISDIASLQGHRLKRSLPVGTALTVDMLTPDLLVRRGQQVTVIAASGPVEIRAQGLALNDGAQSDFISSTGSKTYTYTVCDVGLPNCSAKVVVTY